MSIVCRREMQGEEVGLPSRNLEFRREAILTLTERSRSGLPIYVLAWLMLGASVSFGWPRPALAASLGALVLSMTIARGVLVLGTSPMRASGSVLWLWLFRIAAAGQALAIGILAGALVEDLGVHGAGAIALAIVAALSGSSLFIFAPDLPLNVAFVLALNLPLGVGLLSRGGTGEAATLLADVVLVTYSLVIGRQLNREYREASRAAHLLRAHAADLEDARERLRAAHDDLERKVAERTSALEQREVDYRHIFDGAHDAILIFDPADERVLAVNGRACEIYGFPRERFVGMSLEEISKDPANRERELSRALERGVDRFETVQCRADGSQMLLEINASVIQYQGRRAILSINRDVTARTKLEEELRQARKMEAIGRLAGGIAHDFNNILTAILGYGELMREQVGNDASLREPLEEILQAGERAAKLTRQLLAFSRKQILAPEVIDLNMLVGNMTKLLGRIIGEDVALITVLSPMPALVKADPGQIEQVIMNLAVNARDAMPEGGRLTISTRSDEGRDGSPARNVVLSIRDTGCGMDAETKRHLFEPFFTTKPRGQGTGLGLATVQGIIEQSGGHVNVWSEPGRGSEFEVALPAFAGTKEEVREKENAPEVPRGTETVLLVEDEPQVRQLIRALLEKQGYEVHSASDGEEALALSSAHAGPIQILVTDLVMPGMRGNELAERIQAERKETRVLFISGYTGDSDVKQRVKNERMTFVQKPFQASVLLRKVRETLDASDEDRIRAL